MGTVPVAILFTDLVSSTELVQRAGDESAQRILQAHHKLLKDAVSATGGHELRWMGDGMMATFPSAADAVRCAIAMQQTTRRPIAGERLAIRVGLNVGEPIREEADYFGLSVVIARRLCDRAHGGAILCARVVAELLEGRQAFRFADCGALDLKGVASRIATCEVLYEPEDPAVTLSQPPFVGRTAELATLRRALDDLRAGRGGLVLLMGEPGIGKTRTLEECADMASAQGAECLWGRCYEGEAARPYGAFAEALTDYARRTPAEVAAANLGHAAAPLTRMAPALRERLPTLPEPVALQPDEERARLLDAVVQWLIGLAARQSTVLILDDLHWADAGTVALLRHVARFVSQARLLVLGALRDMEVSPTHPLHDALGVLPREVRYNQIGLAGLGPPAVRELLETIAARDIPTEMVTSLAAETSGNPFFIRQVLLHWLERGELERAGDRWTAARGIADLGLPHSVRQVIEYRIARLSHEARRLLTVAAACHGAFHLRVVARVAEIDDAQALDALDETLGARLLQPAGTADGYEFTHALIRHTLYAAMTSSRQVRLHRQLAEEMEAAYASRTAEHAAAIAQQYARSVPLAGYERGVPHCLTAADNAQRAAAFDEEAKFVRLALELLPPDDPRRPSILGRLALALAWSQSVDEAVRVAVEAGDLVAAADGPEAAADYLADAADAVWGASYNSSQAWTLAEHGMHYIGARRDATWVRLMVLERLRRHAANPEHVGIPLDSADWREVADVAAALPELADVFGKGMRLHMLFVFTSRQDVLARAAGDPFCLAFWAGEVRRAQALFIERAERFVERGQLALAALAYINAGRLRMALGDLSGFETLRATAAALAQRIVVSPVLALQLAAGTLEEVLVRGEGFELWIAAADSAVQDPSLDNQFRIAAMKGAGACGAAALGQRERALQWLNDIRPAIERAPGWMGNYTMVVTAAAGALWELGEAQQADVIEQNLRAKTLIPDFRTMHADSRLALARLCALQHRYDEALHWFDAARAVLDEQGAKPLRAVADFDAAWMYARRGAPGDSERARPLLDAALAQFRAVGMPGWITRADALAQELSQPTASAVRAATPAAEPAASTSDSRPAIFRPEGEYWTIAYAGQTFRLRHARGLSFIAYLLRHPGMDLHASEVVRAASGPREPVAAIVGSNHAAGTNLSGDAGALLDPHAKAEYKRRLDDLQEELVEAREFNDVGRGERLQQEIDFLTHELARAIGLGGRDRRAGSPAERARVNVTRAIAQAVKKIGAHHPPLGQYLTRALKTGTFCTYDPDPRAPVAWQL